MGKNPQHSFSIAAACCAKPCMGRRDFSMEGGRSVIGKIYGTLRVYLQQEVGMVCTCIEVRCDYR